MTTERRFQINPGPLKLRGKIPQPDHNAGRCEASLKNGSGQCLLDAKWSVLTAEGELLVCGQHVRALRDAPSTMAVESLA